MQTGLQIYLIRHGETAWTKSGQHTGTTDIPLTKVGEEQALTLKEHLQKIPFEAVLSSPMKRAVMTCELSGFGKVRKIDPDAVEWNYGRYEGMTTAEIHDQEPEWNIFSRGAPEGDSLRDITIRADRMLKKLLSYEKNVALFSHGHFLRALAARWLHFPAQEGRLFSLSVASISILGFENQQHTLKLWNSTNSL